MRISALTYLFYSGRSGPDPGIFEQVGSKYCLTWTGPATLLAGSVADPDPFDTDTDPAFHFETDPDPAFQYDTDPDPYHFKEVIYLKQYIYTIFT